MSVVVRCFYHIHSFFCELRVLFFPGIYRLYVLALQEHNINTLRNKIEHYASFTKRPYLVNKYSLLQTQNLILNNTGIVSFYYLCSAWMYGNLPGKVFYGEYPSILTRGQCYHRCAYPRVSLFITYDSPVYVSHTGSILYPCIWQTILPQE